MIKKPFKMTQRFGILIILFLVSLNASFSGELLLIGVYQGKNIFVQNPFSVDRKEFCTEEVFVNDIKVLSNIRNSAYTINLSHLSLGSNVSIKIIYKEDCTPKIINPQVIKKEETAISFKEFSIVNDTLSWEINETTYSGKFIIEKYIDNYWKPIVTAASNNKKICRYPFTPELSQGLSKLRIQYLSESGKVSFSESIQPEKKDLITVSRQ